MEQYHCSRSLGFRHAWECGEGAGQGIGHETAAAGQGSPRLRQARAGSGHRARRDGMGRDQAVSRGRRYPDADQRPAFHHFATGATGSARSADRVRPGTHGRRSSGRQFHSGERNHAS